MTQETLDLRIERAEEYVSGSVAETVNECELDQPVQRYLVLEKVNGGEVVNYYTRESLAECADELDASTTDFEDAIIVDLDENEELPVVRRVVEILSPSLKPLVLWRR